MNDTVLLLSSKLQSIDNSEEYIKVLTTDEKFTIINFLIDSLIDCKNVRNLIKSEIHNNSMFEREKTQLESELYISIT